MQITVIIGLLVTYAAAYSLEESSLRIISDSIHDFSSRLCKYLGERERFNYVASPLALDLSLAMLAYAAGDRTSEELYNSLHLPSDPKTGLHGYQYLLNMLKEEGQNDLIMSQKLFLHKNVLVNESYSNLLAQYFYSEIGLVNFKNTRSAAEDINLYMYGRTQQKIKSFIKPEEIDPDTSIMPMNVMYFCGKFLRSFNRSLIDQPFYLNARSTKNVKSMCVMMDQVYYGNVPELKASFVELPYEDSKLTLLLIRPNELGGVKELESKLEKFTIPRLLSYGNLRDVSVTIPPFNIESSLNFKDILQKMGIYSMFEDSASFPQILYREKGIKLDNVIQKVVFNLDDRSTMATGITSYSLFESTMDTFHRTLYSFYLDRPFLFMVLQKDIMVPVFSGRIMDPEPYK